MKRKDNKSGHKDTLNKILLVTAILEAIRLVIEIITKLIE